MEKNGEFESHPLRQTNGEAPTRAPQSVFPSPPGQGERAQGEGVNLLIPDPQSRSSLLQAVHDRLPLAGHEDEDLSDSTH